MKPVPPKNPNMLLWLVAIGFFMEILDATIVTTALPEMARALGENPLSMHSVIIAYSLTLAVFIPVSGWFADRFGIRKVFLSAIIIFTLGSLLCAVSQSLTQIIIFRVLQAFGGSMLLPIGRLAVIRAFPGDKFIGAISFVAIPALIAPLIGPTLGGWLVQFATWHWIFLINIPIGIVGCIATYKAMPVDGPNEPSEFDIKGFILLALFMVCTSVSLDSMSGNHFATSIAIVMLVFGLACLAAYFLHSTKYTNSFFSLKLFKVRTFTIGILGNLFARLGTSSMHFLIPLYLQLCMGLDPFAAGLSMLPIAVAGIVAKRFVAPLILWAGYRTFLIANTFAVGLGIVSVGLINSETPLWLRIIMLFAFGIVNSMQFTAMNTITLKDLDRKSATGGNTLFSMVQMLSLSFAVAVAGAILSTFKDHFATTELELAFRYTFLSMGSLTCISIFIFWQLSEVFPVKLKVDETKTIEPT